MEVLDGITIFWQKRGSNTMGRLDSIILRADIVIDLLGMDRAFDEGVGI